MPPLIVMPMVPTQRGKSSLWPPFPAMNALTPLMSWGLDLRSATIRRISSSCTSRARRSVMFWMSLANLFACACVNRLRGASPPAAAEPPRFPISLAGDGCGEARATKIILAHIASHW